MFQLLRETVQKIILNLCKEIHNKWNKSVTLKVQYSKQMLRCSIKEMFFLWTTHIITQNNVPGKQGISGQTPNNASFLAWEIW